MWSEGRKNKTGKLFILLGCEKSWKSNGYFLLNFACVHIHEKGPKVTEF